MNRPEGFFGRLDFATQSLGSLYGILTRSHILVVPGKGNDFFELHGPAGGLGSLQGCLIQLCTDNGEITNHSGLLVDRASIANHPALFIGPGEERGGAYRPATVKPYFAGTTSRFISADVRDRVNCMFLMVVCCWPETGTLE
jgi:hypothetical protein